MNPETRKLYEEEFIKVYGFPPSNDPELFGAFWKMNLILTEKEAKEIEEKWLR